MRQELWLRVDSAFLIGRWGARGENINICLTRRSASDTVFQKVTGKLATMSHRRGGTAIANRANREGDQVIENKQFCEMAHFAAQMISIAYAERAKRFISLKRNEPFGVC
jgi:hypothetical protein